MFCFTGNRWEIPKQDKKEGSHVGKSFAIDCLWVGNTSKTDFENGSIISLFGEVTSSKLRVSNKNDVDVFFVFVFEFVYTKGGIYMHCNDTDDDFADFVWKYVML